MLVLTRKRGESIIINHTTKITFLSMDRDRLQLGIDAPQDVSVHRAEIEEAIRNSGIDTTNRGKKHGSNSPRDRDRGD